MASSIFFLVAERTARSDASRRASGRKREEGDSETRSRLSTLSQTHTNTLTVSPQGSPSHVRGRTPQATRSGTRASRTRNQPQVTARRFARRQRSPANASTSDTRVHARAHHTQTNKGGRAGTQTRKAVGHASAATEAERGDKDTTTRQGGRRHDSPRLSRHSFL